jgi:hypothetical protein
MLTEAARNTMQWRLFDEMFSARELDLNPADVLLKGK